MARQGSPFTLRYLEVNPETLDARELIATLSAITQISEKACQALYGVDTEASFRIVQVQRGTIGIKGAPA
jgi:hypothetical protein